jgi:hypothetical protein
MEDILVSLIFVKQMALNGFIEYDSTKQGVYGCKLLNKKVEKKTEFHPINNNHVE